MRMLDLFCGAGGAAMGYHRAGFEVVGVDINPQPNYPFRFMEGDALEVLESSLARKFDVIHASPPCQAYSIGAKQHGTEESHPDLVKPVRELLIATGLPYVIENVERAPLIDPVKLCGSQFGWRRLRRHRLFESSAPLRANPCNHSIQKNCISVAGNPGGSSARDGAERFGSTDVWRQIMGIDWMTSSELKEAIPPAYTEYLGLQLRAHLMTREVVAA